MPVSRRLELVLATVAALSAGAAPGLAQEVEGRVVVVELFTSQGCSSCPPADEMMHYLAKREDVIALALHVDYWDYIGWKDSFAQPKFTKRQKSYAHAAGERMIYTPQIIIGGLDHVLGSRPMEISDMIARHADLPPLVTLRLTRQGERLRIDAGPPVESQGEMAVQLVRYTPEETVEITRGENAGRTVTYVNIVTEWTELARWTGTEPLALEVPAPGPLPLAVIVQRAGHGPIVAAAALR